MTMKIETTEVLTVIFCLYSVSGIPDNTVQRTIGAIHNVVVWMEVTQDHELVRLGAFAPDVYRAYVGLLNSVRHNKSHSIPEELVIKIIRDALHLERISTEAVKTRMVSEIESDREMKRFDFWDIQLTNVGETLSRIFSKN